MSVARACCIAVILCFVAPAARADVVEACPPWEEGYLGHGDECRPNYAALACGGLVCAGAVLGALVLVGTRSRAAPRTRGD